MAYQLFQLPKQTNISSSFTLAAGARAYFFETGTTTPQDTYQDAGLTTPHAHPVVADAAGVLPTIFLDPTLEYDLTLKTSADVLIYSVEKINDQLLSQSIIGSLLYPRTAAEISAGVTPSNYSYPPGSILRYGAVGDGTTNDSAAIQRAVDVAEISGGTVYFPPGYKWGMGTQVTISSQYPVNLVGEMTANPTASSSASYIRPTGNITGSLFKYVSPTATISQGGAGIISGLSFVDDTDRTRTMTACLDLDSFSAGIVENCSFHKIIGSAILFGYVVQTRFSNLHIRWSGDTSKAAMLARSTGDYQLQGCTFASVISEVNYLAPHIQLASNSNDNKFTGLTFETTETADETSNFMTISGVRNIVVGATFNRRPSGGYAVEFATGASLCVVAESVFDLAAGKAVLFTADRNQLRGGFIQAATSSAAPVVFTGVRNSVQGVYFYNAPGFVINSASNEVAACVFDTTVGSSGYVIDVQASGTNAHIIGNRFIGVPSGVGGVQWAAQGICANNNIGGGGGASIGVRVNSPNVSVEGNYVVNFGTAQIQAVSAGYEADIHNNIGYVNKARGAVSVADGGTITHGLSGTPTNARVTCSTTGEFASVTALGATTLTLAIKKHDNSAGTTQTIYWEAAL